MTRHTIHMSRCMVTHMGVMQACLRRLGRTVDDAWLFGATGYAFMLNIPEGVGVWGPQAWNTLSIAERMTNLGVSTSTYVESQVKEPDFREKQAAARELAESAVRYSLPCFGVEHGHPDYFLVIGTNDEGLVYHTQWTGEVTRKWEDLGTPDVGHLVIGCMEPLGEPASDEKTIGDALRFAVRLEDEGPEWIGAQCTGLAAYDAWIAGLQSDLVRSGVIYHPDGTFYNAQFWCECRQYAEPFLREAGRRLDPELVPLFDMAAGHYSDVARALRGVARQFAVMEGDLTDEMVTRSIALLAEAKDAEAGALRVLRELAGCL